MNPLDVFIWTAFHDDFFFYTPGAVCVSLSPFFFVVKGQEVLLVYFPTLYSQSCCSSVLAKHSLKRQYMVWQKLSRRDLGVTNRQLDSGTLSGSSVK